MVKEALQREVVDLHEFFVRWYAGRAYPAELPAVLDRFHPDFLYVFPAGARSTFADLEAMLRTSHGVNPRFGIEVQRFSFQHLGDHHIWGVTYEEYQWGARNSTSENGRISSAVFDLGGGTPVWLRLHETWLPDDVVVAFHERHTRAR